MKNQELLKKLRKKYEVKEIQPWHWRVENKFDVFPKNKRFFVLSKKEWGNYRDIEGKIKHHLMLEQHKKGEPKKKSRGAETWIKEFPDENTYHSWVGVPERECHRRRQLIREGKRSSKSFRKRRLSFTP